MLKRDENHVFVIMVNRENLTTEERTALSELFRGKKVFTLQFNNPRITDEDFLVECDLCAPRAIIITPDQIAVKLLVGNKYMVLMMTKKGLVEITDVVYKVRELYNGASLE